MRHWASDKESCIIGRVKQDELYNCSTYYLERVSRMWYKVVENQVESGRVSQSLGRPRQLKLIGEVRPEHRSPEIYRGPNQEFSWVLSKHIYVRKLPELRKNHTKGLEGTILVYSGGARNSAYSYKHTGKPQYLLSTN